MSTGAEIWSDAATAAALFAIDPVGTSGICVRAGAGPVRDRWLESLRGLLPPSMPWRKMPPAISDSRLLGGIDLAASLQAGRPMVERGLLAEVDGGVLLAAMAERLPVSTVAHLNAVLDAHELRIERDGLSQKIPSAFGVIAFDEGVDDESISPSLGDRLALHVDLRSLSLDDATKFLWRPDAVDAARRRSGQVRAGPEVVDSLCRTAAALGIASLRAPTFAVRVARAAAAFDESGSVGREHVELAARLVLAPRATRLPAAEQEAEPPPDQKPDEAEDTRHEEAPLEDVVLEAARAAIPADLLRRLQEGGICRTRTSSAGKQGISRTGPKRGRPIGTRRGELVFGARVNVLETLRSAAPWQKLRREADGMNAGRPHRLLIRKSDFRITRFKEKSATSTIFVVDASGSSALQRLAEVKGAVELLLADCYVRRDEVALIAFRGKAAELILPPTRSLARAKRSLAALPGGGGTPLSAAIISATDLALAVRGKGHSPTIVLMTDGRANVCRDGSAGRAVAEAEAQEVARQLGATGIAAIVIDTSPRPEPQAQKVAAAMSARYVALPFADASRLTHAVQSNMRAG